MRKEILKEIITGFHNSTLPAIKPRQIQIPLKTDKIISIIGVRRSGKTYLLFETIKRVLAEKNIKEIFYINFEDERLDIEGKNLDLLLQAYRELYPQNDLSGCYFFFDEIQNVDKWEKFIRRMYDTVSKKIYITGSNAQILGTEIATSLRGRTLRYEVYPLSFREYLIFKDINLNLPNDLYNPEKKALLISAFNNYLFYGGFPEVAFWEDEEIKKNILQEYFDVMVYRDLIERYRITNIPVLKYFLKRVFENVARPISIHNIFNEIRSQGYKVSKDTLYQFLEQAESVYIIKLLKKYSQSVLKQEFASKKVYCIDNGLLNALSFKLNKDYGKLLENLVFKELIMRYKNIFYFKDKKECDFILPKKNKYVPLQVCYDISEKQTLNREIEGILNMSKFFSVNEGYIINAEKKDTIKVENTIINLIPAYEFVLDTEN